jgi:hypothetical protein
MRNIYYFCALIWTQGVWAATDHVPTPIGHNSMMAASPFTDYTAGVVVYVLLVGLLVTVLLIGGMLVLNLGLMSKRDTDRVGTRNPSDVEILKTTLWPLEHDETPHLPAEEEDEGEGGDQSAA